MQVLLLVLTVLMVDGVVYLFNIVQTWVYTTCHFSRSEYTSC